MEEVILVNSDDQALGTMEKMEAHRQGLLHRAFSVFVFNDNNELMLQQRALDKYHSGGLWTNTCCSHPRSGESIMDAGKRRLQEEMGFVTDLTHLYSFIYKARLDNELTEHELDHVLIGKFDDAPKLNMDEAASWKFISMDDLKKDIELNPDNYTIWFKLIFEEVEPRLSELLK